MRLAIASGKGGTGKTTLAVNLAHYASTLFKTALVDLDVEEPNSGLFLNGSLQERREMYRQAPHWDRDKCTSCGKCVEYCRFNALIKLDKIIMVLPELCHSCFACTELCPEQALPMQPLPMGVLQAFQYGGLSFIESKLKIGVEQAVPLINQTLSYASNLEQRPEMCILDCPPGTSCPVIAATREADFVLLVTEPTPFGLYDLKLAVGTMRQLGKPMAVVVNRYGIGNDEVLDYCAEEQIPIWAKIPNLRYVAELYSSGEMLYDKVPEIQKALDNILANLSQVGAPA
jgi:MinD superfamily P-loop ATPase